MPTSDAITEKVTCETCQAFVGFIRANGTGPIFGYEECSARKASKCPTVSRLSKYQPKLIPTGLAGGRSGPLDEDSGGYGAIARRCLEDQ